MSDQEEVKTKIIPVNIEDVMRTDYINYAMYVIVHRALPDVRDGLKPVQRRILLAMKERQLTHDKAYKKTVTAVGDTMGKYHPHGTEAIYQALVRMAQYWSMRYLLVDGHGNFGSVDGDMPAAMRYTEGKLQRLAEEGLLMDLSKEVVAYQSNYDSSLEEPTVLPARLPNLLVNGCSGIAVGMATNMPPHNLCEVVEGIIAYIDNHDISIEELIEYIKAPDFPTGGIIYGLHGIRKAFLTGKGSIVVRGRATIEVLPSGRQQIIVTELPYVVNKANMIAKTAQLINEKKLLGIADLRDESDRNGMRVVYDLKRDAIANVVLNNLYKQTALQSTFSVNNITLVNREPKLLNLKDLIRYYVDHRYEIVTRRTKAELKRTQHQAHLLEGYLLVLDHIDEIVKLIKKSPDASIAKANLIKVYQLSEIQVKAILDMRLQRLTGLEQGKTLKQYQEVQAHIKHLEAILGDRGMRMNIIKKELGTLRDRYGDKRRTEIVPDSAEFSMEDMIPNEAMVITLSQQGYIKSIPLSTYKVQNRGGVGSKGATAKKEDSLSQVFVASAHNYLLIFTSLGKVYWKKVYQLPKGGKSAQGRAIQNLLDIAPGDTVRSILKIKHLDDPEYIKDRYITLCTEKGTIKKTPLAAFTRPMRRGIRAITFKEGDQLLEARLTQGDDYIVIGLRSGKAIRFPHSEIRSMGRTAAGVRGIRLGSKDDKVIGMLSTPENKNTTLLVISEKGYGKRSFIQDYRCTHRGGKGVKTIQITPKTGALIAIKPVEDSDGLMIMNASGITIRSEIKALRTMRRATQGVRLIRLRKEDKIASIAIIKTVDSAEEEPKEEPKEA